MGPDETFTSLRMGVEPFFDMMEHISNLVSKHNFDFNVAVPEALSFTITNEVMDIEGEYNSVKTLFKLDGTFVDPGVERGFVEEVRKLVLEPSVTKAWASANPMWVTPEQVRDLQSAAALSRPVVATEGDIDADRSGP